MSAKGFAGEYFGPIVEFLEHVLEALVQVRTECKVVNEHNGGGMDIFNVGSAKIYRYKVQKLPPNIGLISFYNLFPSCY